MFFHYQSLSGPRIFLYCGLLYSYSYSGSKIFLGFLFNDFLLLTKIDKQLIAIQKSTSKNNNNNSNNKYFSIDPFNNPELKIQKYEMYRKPILLEHLTISERDKYQFTQNSILFQIEFNDDSSETKKISLRVNTLDEWVAWQEVANRAKQNYIKLKNLYKEIDKISVSTPKSSQIPVAVFKLISIEAFQLYTRNCMYIDFIKFLNNNKINISMNDKLLHILDALNAYCKVVMGKTWDQAHSTRTSKVVRRVMDFRTMNMNNNQREQHTPSTLQKKSSFLSKLGVRTRRSIASLSSFSALEDEANLNNYTTINNNKFNSNNKEDCNNNNTDNNPHRLLWQFDSIPLKVYHAEDVLFIQCYDASPYAPHEILAEATITVRELIQQQKHQFYSLAGHQCLEVITCQLPLRIPNEQLSTNLALKLNIQPYLKIKFDIIIRMDQFRLI